MQKDAYADLEFLNDVGSSDSEKKRCLSVKSKVFFCVVFFCPQSFSMTKMMKDLPETNKGER